ncbi:aa3-type cytochrome c oxidase subunit IV [Oceanibacterium hippocampi]|uniref:Bacterial aa3 type cytochrome c oxidase subunit IV n=1 Tax=Oceanibacterium hippocampi TaxID=745714 RepID=A0A1Y5S9D7_9PROT|nr:aa3-type cytochrome c oxidase subunit IV [Oceanibacterium hippocampi]SLN35451.1 Bacterial aa3 type cytochrome c oxidase subunit IV [Oceanibacterium hippocampi]
MSDTGKMDISAQKAMWRDFTRFTVWSTGFVIVLLVLMALFLL